MWAVAYAYGSELSSFFLNILNSSFPLEILCTYHKTNPSTCPIQTKTELTPYKLVVKIQNLNPIYYLNTWFDCSKYNHRSFRGPTVSHGHLKGYLIKTSTRHTNVTTLLWKCTHSVYIYLKERQHFDALLASQKSCRSAVYILCDRRHFKLLKAFFVWIFIIFELKKVLVWNFWANVVIRSAAIYLYIVILTIWNFDTVRFLSLKNLCITSGQYRVTSSEMI